MPRTEPQAAGHGRPAARLAVFMCAALLPLAGWAVCTCGFGDGRFTRVTISADGDMADWAPVHADTDNNVCDGPINGLLDRDVVKAPDTDEGEQEGQDSGQLHGGPPPDTTWISLVWSLQWTTAPGKRVNERERIVSPRPVTAVSA